MTITHEEIIHETSVFYYYSKNKGNHEENTSKKSSNNAPKINNGYCRLDIKVELKTYDNDEQYYYISYTWGFKPWGEWGDINFINNGGKLLSWQDILEIEEKLVDGKKSSPILQKVQKLKALFPFYQDEEFIENSMDGDIIKKNNMTTEMVNSLAMTNDEIAAISGKTTSYRYRLNIMSAITLFWD